MEMFETLSQIFTQFVLYIDGRVVTAMNWLLDRIPKERFQIGMTIFIFGWSAHTVILSIQAIGYQHWILEVIRQIWDIDLRER